MAALEQAVPVHGVLRAPDALAAAAASLAQGTQAAKQIVLIGDGQAVGWQTDDLESWRFLDEAFAHLPAKPRVFVRTLELPQGIRNLTVKDVAFSRPVVGTDRDVRVDVTVANTGREAVTPARVTLTAGGREKVDRSVGQMEPGVERVVSFLHRFDTPGAQVVDAHVAADDELAADDTMRRVIQIMRTLKVLVADDGRAVRLFDRAGGYVALALMPSVSGLTEPAKGRGNAGHFLMEPELTAVSGLGLKRSLAGYAAAVLADVPTLPEEQAAQLADFVRRGGSLLLVHGARSDPAFYNGWQSAGERVAPLPIGACAVASGDDGRRGVNIDPSTFRHPALALFRESGDLSDAVVECYRQAVETDGAPGVVARLQNGAALMAEHTLGKGRVAQLFVPLDRTAGNLVVRQSFLPLIQEVTSYLAQPVIATLNLPPSRGAVVQLSPPAFTQMSGGGVLGEYFKFDKKRLTPILTRVDPSIAFWWGQEAPAEKMPRDGFAVRWSGTFTPKESGDYTFHVKADDRLDLRIGRHSVHASHQTGEQKMFGSFKAGERYSVSASYEEEGGEAYAVVEMEGPGFPREKLPADWLSPSRGGDSWADAVDTQVLAPSGRTLYAKIRYGEDGLALRTDSPLMQGIYEVKVPSAAAGWLGHLAGANDAFPLCVTENPDESRLDALTADEQAIIARLADVTVAHSFEDLQKALHGKTFGRELWRIPALALFLLLVLEPVLTRWIFVQRNQVS
jgi:hypothetical protein